MATFEYEFPCEYPIKAIGPATVEFERSVLKIIKKHVKDLEATQIKRKKSQKDNYLSLTIQIIAESQTQLESIYTDLKASKHVLMVL